MRTKLTIIPNRRGGSVAMLYSSLFILLLFSLSSVAQPMLGHLSTNYAGIQRVTFNPSAIAGTRMQWQLSPVTFGATINNRYFKYFASDALFHPLKNAYSSKDIYGKSKLTGTFTQGTNLNVWSELRGPSGFMGFGKKNQFSLGLQTRMRGYIQGTGLPPVLAEVYTKRLDFGTIQASSGSFANFTASQLSFFETGLTAAFAGNVGDVLKVKFGASIKRLSGARNVYLKINNAPYQVRVLSKDEALLDLNNVNYEYGYTQPVANFDLSKIYSDKYGSGWAADAGLTIELGKIRNSADYRSNYIVRLAAALTDLGTIYYPVGQGKRYSGTLSKTNVDQLRLIDLGDNSVATLEKIFPKTNPKDYTYTTQLPQTFNLDVDFHLAQSFFVNAALIRNSNSTNDVSLPTQVQHPQIITLAPRWEDEDAQFTIPISWIEGNQSPTVGFSVRLGPAFIGFSNFSGMLKIHDPRGTFVYFGLQLFRIKDER
jgi:Family of unknown function (DUF5723)